MVYSLSGETFDQALRIDTTAGRSFTDVDALSRSGATYYRVSTIDACGQESDLAGQPAKAGVSP